MLIIGVSDRDEEALQCNQRAIDMNELISENINYSSLKGKQHKLT